MFALKTNQIQTPCRHIDDNNKNKTDKSKLNFVSEDFRMSNTLRMESATPPKKSCGSAVPEKTHHQNMSTGQVAFAVA